MHTVRIPVDKYIDEFLRTKFRTEDGVVVLDPKTNVYIMLYDMLKLRPKKAYVPPVDGTEFKVPRPHQALKNPMYYNYLTESDINTLKRVFRTMFWAEAREFMEDCKHRCNIEYLNSARMFLERYNVQSITDWALVKNHKRYREKNRRHVLRQYKFKENSIFIKKK